MNDYLKTSTTQKRWSLRCGQHGKEYLHSEVLTMLRRLNLAVKATDFVYCSCRQEGKYQRREVLCYLSGYDNL